MSRAPWLAVALALAGPAAAACPPAPPPVVTLALPSRYAAGDPSRAAIDPAAAAAAEAALAPVDDFLRDLAARANSALRGGEGAAAAADCAVAQLAQWARAGALADLGTGTAALVAGSRLAGFGLVLMQAGPRAADRAAAADAAGWLAARVRGQIRFWEEQAPPAARRGNLRAWAALAAAAGDAVSPDPVMRSWAAWSAAEVLCTAAPDGSLPREMERGPRALHYQLHAVAPLAVAVLLLARAGLDLAPACGHALDRAAAFALDDIAARGALSAAITGAAQSVFAGGDGPEPFQLAFLEAWAALGDRPAAVRAEALAAPLRPLSHSKLGGNQTLLWHVPRTGTTDAR